MKKYLLTVALTVAAVSAGAQSIHAHARVNGLVDYLVKALLIRQNVKKGFLSSFFCEKIWRKGRNCITFVVFY